MKGILYRYMQIAFIDHQLSIGYYNSECLSKRIDRFIFMTNHLFKIKK